MCLLQAKDNKAVVKRRSGKFKTGGPFIFIEMSVMFAPEKDVFCYIFQNICRAKRILIHEKIPDIITNRR